MRSLEGKILVITGASSGLGLAIAKQAAAKGASLILLARDPQKLEQAHEQLKRYAVITKCFTTDVSAREQVKATFARIESQFGRIDVLINNAGFGLFQRLAEMSLEEYERMISINYLGAVYCTKYALPMMLRQQSGHMINIASQSGKVGTPKTSAYAASKHALLGFTNSIRHELRQDGITVSAVNPGPISTPFLKQADVSGTYVQNIARYLLDPDQVAKRVVQLIEKPKRELNLPMWMEIGSRLINLFPCMIERTLGNRLFKK
jgi:short-subunit dehydrogenase